MIFISDLPGLALEIYACAGRARRFVKRFGVVRSHISLFYICNLLESFLIPTCIGLAL